jgi:glyoxylase-like metal-dependent hydrolase (beta-lactamase superfamily II)
MSAAQDPEPIAWQLVSDGQADYERGFIFGRVAPEELDAAGIGSVVVTPFNALLVRSGRRVILVDAGLGELAGEEAEGAGLLLDSLGAAGVAPTDVHDVIVTHAHPDHVGGLTSGGWPTFPRARHHVSAPEVDFWLGPHPEQRLFAPAAEVLVGAARAALTTLQDADLLVACAPDAQIAPGVRLVPAPGHTPGHVAVAIDDGGDTLLYLADVLLHEEELAHPEWTSVVDTDPAATVATRRAILDRAVEAGARIAGFHLESVMRLSRDGGGYRQEAAG